MCHNQLNQQMKRLPPGIQNTFHSNALQKGHSSTCVPRALGGQGHGRLTGSLVPGAQATCATLTGRLSQRQQFGTKSGSLNSQEVGCGHTSPHLRFGKQLTGHHSLVCILKNDSARQPSPLCLVQCSVHWRVSTKGTLDLHGEYAELGKKPCESAPHFSGPVSPLETRGGGPSAEYLARIPYRNPHGLMSACATQGTAGRTQGSGTSRALSAGS